MSLTSSPPRVAIAALAAALLLPTALLAQSPALQPGVQPATPEIHVTGMGEARATPDRARITIGVQTRAATAAAASAGNARKQTAILDTLRKLGFTSQQLTTENYSVHPEMQYDERGQRPRILGYVVSNTVRVEVRDLDRAGAVLDAALAKGANEIGGLSFYLADPAPVRRRALQAAVANARSEAETLARAAGGSLGPIIQISSTVFPTQPVMARGKVMSLGADAGASTPIEAGEEQVQTVVSIRWAFVPTR